MIESTNNSQKQVRCPICKTQNKSYLVFSLSEEAHSQINMVVCSIKRLDAQYYQNLKCNATPGCQNYAPFVCDLCHKENTQQCIQYCSSPHQTILQQYNSTLFYCGYGVDAEEICFKNQAAPFLQKLKEITCQNNRDIQIQQALAFALRQKISINRDNSKIYCPFCPHYSHAEHRKTSEHVRHTHAELAVKHRYAQTMCFQCNIAFISQKTIYKHICKKDKANKSFANKILSGAKHQQFEHAIKKKIVPNSINTASLENIQHQIDANERINSENKIQDQNIVANIQDANVALNIQKMSAVNQEQQLKYQLVQQQQQSQSELDKSQLC